jgi:hypothetical protein
MQSDIDNIDTIIQLLLISFMLSASYVGGGGGVGPIQGIYFKYGGWTADRTDSWYQQIGHISYHNMTFMNTTSV